MTVRNSSSLRAVCKVEPLLEPFATDLRGEFLLSSGAKKDIPIAFRPTDGLLHLETLRLTSSDGSCELSVPIRGLGSGLLNAQPDLLVFKLGAGERQTRLRVRPKSPGPKNYLIAIVASRAFVEPVAVTISTVAEVLQPCTMDVAPVSPLVLGDAADGGLEGRVTFTNRGTARCLIDNPRLDAGTSDGFAITAGGGSQIEVLPGGTHEVSIAGPRLPVGWGIGALGFHVFRDGGAEEWIELRAP